MFPFVLILNKTQFRYHEFSVLEAGVSLERKKPVCIVKRKWTSRECSATRILFKLSFVVVVVFFH